MRSPLRHGTARHGTALHCAWASKTTLSERVCFYTGRINAIHEVRGKDGVGAVLDSMELERTRGVTIQSAATYTHWGDHSINLIDTPGHVDFTIEVERALRVLDGAVLVLCGVSGVQSQSLTVDRQMKRYGVPRVAFINKLDRTGADPWPVIDGLRNMLDLNAAAVQVPIGLESEHIGHVDLLRRRSVFFAGDHGEKVEIKESVPDELSELVEEKRSELVERLAEVDEEMEEMFLAEEEASVEQLEAAIRRTTIARTFVPVFMGSAFKNKGVQPLLDGVIKFLPDPTEVENVALDLEKDEAEVKLSSDPNAKTVALAFKLEESRFGQLTYMRVYQGTISKGDMLMNTTTKKKTKIPRLVRMHANQMEDVESVSAGEICAMFGVECESGTSFCDPSLSYAMTSMHVPEPVMSLSVKPKNKDKRDQFARGINRFTKEDPTFRVHYDTESQETIMSGMGELHLDIYRQRLEMEYGVETVVGRPQVKFRESITSHAAFHYRHKKQSGGSGQFAEVQGFVEPLPEDSEETFVFENHLIGNNIPPEFIPALEKGFKEGAENGCLIGSPVRGVRVVIEDGAAHAVDSNEIAFRTAARNGLTQGIKSANPVVLEPVMRVEVEAPNEFQGTVVGGLNRRKGMIQDVGTGTLFSKVVANVPLAEMFGYSTDLRSTTEGKGEFSMEFAQYQPVARDVQEELMKKYEEKRKSGDKGDDM